MVLFNNSIFSQIFSRHLNKKRDQTFSHKILHITCKIFFPTELANNRTFSFIYLKSKPYSSRLKHQLLILSAFILIIYRQDKYDLQTCDSKKHELLFNKKKLLVVSLKYLDSICCQNLVIPNLLSSCVFLPQL